MLDERQPQPCPPYRPRPARIDAVEPLKQAGMVFGGDTRPLINYLDGDAVLEAGGRDAEPGLCRGVLDGVIDEVAEGVLEGFDVDGDLQILRQIEDELQAALLDAGSEAVDDLVDERGEALAIQREVAGPGLDAGEVEDVLDEGVEAAGVPVDDAEHGGEVGGEVGLLLQQALAVAEDGGDGGAQFMGDVGHEFAAGALGEPDGGDVEDDAEAACAVGQRHAAQQEIGASEGAGGLGGAAVAGGFEEDGVELLQIGDVREQEPGEIALEGEQAHQRRVAAPDAELLIDDDEAVGGLAGHRMIEDLLLGAVEPGVAQPIHEAVDAVADAADGVVALRQEGVDIALLEPGEPALELIQPLHHLEPLAGLPDAEPERDPADQHLPPVHVAVREQAAPDHDHHRGEQEAGEQQAAESFHDRVARMKWLEMLIQWLLPVEVAFFDHVEKAAVAAQQAATLMGELVRAQGRDAQILLLERIREAEHDGDRAMKDMMDALDKSFVTPIDREDLYHLTAAIESVSDFISSTANHLTVHQMETLPEGSRELTDIIVKSASEFLAAVRLLKDGRAGERIRAHCQSLHYLEHEADVIFRLRLGDLFAHEQNAIQLIKHKEFLEGLEEAVDQCSRVGTVLEAIVIKHG